MQYVVLENCCLVHKLLSLPSLLFLPFFFSSVTLRCVLIKSETTHSFLLKVFCVPSFVKE